MIISKQIRLIASEIGKNRYQNFGMWTFASFIKQKDLIIAYRDFHVKNEQFKTEGSASRRHSIYYPIDLVSSRREGGGK